ncbi:MAG TPA: type II secretion system protein GspF [Nitrospiraceae bacterium]|nr:MAG: type II secretion system protein GspF [Nitrospirae bacterium RIFCSPLOWO2_02_42_7]HBI22646.1 type II secretion system protein GspF [Nitrospiraceae bacterium]
MPVFEYRGLTAEGKDTRGFIDAENLQSAKTKLKKSGVFPVSISEETKKKAEGEPSAVRSILRRVKKTEISIFTRQLTTLLTAGLPLMEALSATIDHIDDPVLKRTITRIREDVREGRSLADAMRAHPRAFSGLYTNMIQAGETSGALDVVLARLADFQESQVKLRNKIWATMTYPVMMLFIGLGVMVFLFTFVIPQVTRVFEDLGQALPLPTLVLISISNFFRFYWWVIIGVILILTFALAKYIKTPKGKVVYDRLILKAPLFGKIIKLIAISRFSRTLSTLLASGVPLIASMDIVKAVVNNSVLSKVLEDTKDRVREGEALSEPLKRSGMFPSMVIQMITVGERSGELERMLSKVSDAYDNEVDTTVAGLTSLLEPVMILVMGVIVLFVVLSILLPIFEMSQVVR